MTEDLKMEPGTWEVERASRGLYLQELHRLGGLNELLLHLGGFLHGLPLALLQPGAQLRHTSRYKSMCCDSLHAHCADVCVCKCVYQCVVLLQLLHVLQQSVLGLGVLQQSAHIKHVVQVGLDLDQQPVTLREL